MASAEAMRCCAIRKRVIEKHILSQDVYFKVGSRSGAAVPAGSGMRVMKWDDEGGTRAGGGA